MITPFPSTAPGLNKVYYPDDHEDLLRACGGHVFDFIEHRDHIKRSSGSAAFTPQDLRDLAPPPGFFMGHVIGMGDYETYGWNRNGDAFRKIALQTYHPTFVQYGHLYREHRNRDPKTQGLGVIKAARFNEEMGRVELVVHAAIDKCQDEFQKASSGAPLSVSMSCFPAGTKVRMADGTLRAIEALNCGDQVVTHHGNIGTISHVLRRDYDDKGVELEAVGVWDKLRMTADHPVWVRPDAKHVHECPVCGGKFRSLKAHLRQKQDGKHQAAYRDLSRYCEGFRLADSIRPGDEIRIPVDQQVDTTEEPDADLAWLLGLYLAEGHIYRFDNKATDRRGAEPRHYSYAMQRLDLTLGAHESDLAEKARRILQRHSSNKVTVFQQNGRNVLKVRLTARRGLEAGQIMDWLYEHGGHLGHQKQLSTRAMRWTPAIQKKIVEGWLDGDGAFHKQKHFIAGTTTSEVLAIQFQQLLARNRLPATLHSRQPAGRKRSYHVQIAQRHISQIDFCRKSEANWMADYAASIGHLKHQTTAQTAQRRKAACLLRVDRNGHLYGRVRKVRSIHLQEPVYDLTVPGDHGFVAGGIGVSNCSVPYDVCNCCGHMAKSAAEYCIHARRFMNRFLPQFQKYAFVFNDHPRFFDLSWVARPADRIAHYLSYAFGESPELLKAASEDGDRVILGADWAAYEGVNLPPHVVMTKLSAEQIDMLRELAAAEEWLDGFMNKQASAEDPRTDMTTFVLSRAMRPDTEVSDWALEQVGKLQPGTFFRKLARESAILSFPAFVAYVTGNPVEQVKQSAEIKASMCKLPRLFRDLLQGFGDNFESPVGDLFSSCSPVMEAMDGGGDDVVQRAMDHMTEQFGASLRPMQDRAMAVTVKIASDDSGYDSSVASDDGLLHAYGIYKLSALRDIAELGRGLDRRFLPLIASAQNRAIIV